MIQRQNDPGDVPSGSELPPIPVGSKARRIPFNDDAIAAICETLRTSSRPAAFSYQDAPVVQAEVAGRGGREPVMLVFWRSLQRVDATTGQATVVMTKIEAVDLVEGVEVQFRRAEGFLIVALGGQIIVKM
jgi:hypothetical protein